VTAPRRGWTDLHARSGFPPPAEQEEEQLAWRPLVPMWAGG